MEEQTAIGSWVKIKILGCGGFGQVSLWYKEETEEYIAIKRLHENDSRILKEKHMERWRKEVEIMKKLKHLNIVKALTIPAELECLSKFPMLAMEYCNLGDLRQILNKQEHCCGLSESMVINILRDVSNGLAYLHACKIIHRDLKPDNIVLQYMDSVIIYKLIDLGYAKELDQNSVCKSFVGTIQYLAPELFLGKPYTCSVDYWSFGIVAHEIITGYRPFLPGSNPPEWMSQIQNKPRNVISVIENINGEIIFSSTISRVNHISRCLLQDIEKWLQLALDWDGETRGKHLHNKKLLFFDVLNNILNKVIVKIFSLPTYETLTYEIKSDTSISHLKKWLQKDTGVEADEQVLLLFNGKNLDSITNLMLFLQQEVANPDFVSLFLYNCGLLKIKSRVVLKPLYVKELLEDPKKTLNYKHLKRSCSDSMFFLQSEMYLYKCLMEALRLKIGSIQRKEDLVEVLFEDVAEEWCQMENFAEFLILSHKSDLENYIQLRKDGELHSSDLIQKWIYKVTDIERKLNELRSSSNKHKLRHAINEAKQKSENLVNNEFLKLNHDLVLNNLLNEEKKILDNIRNMPKENRSMMRSNTDTVKVLYRCIEYTTKILRSPLMDLLFLKISEAEEHLSKLVSPLTIWLKSTQIMKQFIENAQRERQREIWSLIIKEKLQNLAKSVLKSEKVERPRARTSRESRMPAASSTDGENKNSFSPFHIPKTVLHTMESPVEEVLKPNFRIMEPVSVVPYKSPLHVNRPDIQFNILKSLETDNIINTNNYLRYRVQEMNQSCHHLMKEMKSLDWDSLSESFNHNI